MSRTHRTPKWDITLVKLIADRLDYHKRYPYKTVKVRRDQDEYDRQVAWAEAELAERVAANNGETTLKYYCPWRKETRYRELSRNHVGRYKYEKVPETEEEVIADAMAFHKRLKRDGHWNETTCNKGFKKDANSTVRNNNKRFCNKVVRDDDWEGRAYPIRKEGKYHRWNWW